MNSTGVGWAHLDLLGLFIQLNVRSTGRSRSRAHYARTGSDSHRIRDTGPAAASRRWSSRGDLRGRSPAHQPQDSAVPHLSEIRLGLMRVVPRSTKEGTKCG